MNLRSKIETVLASDMTSYAIATQTRISLQTILRIRKKDVDREKMIDGLRLINAEKIADWYDTEGQKAIKDAEKNKRKKERGNHK